MKNEAREALDAYYREAGSWAEDGREALRGSRRTAWIVAGVACTIALMEAAALLALTPLKTVEPYTLLVDKQTGYVQALKPLDAQQVSANAALTQSFLVQYVIARESFDATSLQASYRKVSLWSEGAARTAYVADFVGAANRIDVRISDANADGTARIQFGGASILARNTLPAATRDGILIMRPEDLRLSANASADAQAQGQALPGTVVKRQYLGGKTSYKLALADDTVISVESHGDNHDGFDIGTRVMATIDPSKAVVIAS